MKVESTTDAPINENNLQEIKPFKQVPFCEENVMLSITPSEFEILQNIMGIFRAPLDAIQSIFDRNINEDNIQIKYIQQDGTEISKEEATEFLEKASEYIKSKEKPLN